MSEYVCGYCGQITSGPKIAAWFADWIHRLRHRIELLEDHGAGPFARVRRTPMNAGGSN